MSDWLVVGGVVLIFLLGYLYYALFGFDNSRGGL